MDIKYFKTMKDFHKFEPDQPISGQDFNCSPVLNATDTIDFYGLMVNYNCSCLKQLK